MCIWGSDGGGPGVLQLLQERGAAGAVATVPTLHPHITKQHGEGRPARVTEPELLLPASAGVHGATVQQLAVQQGAARCMQAAHTDSWRSSVASHCTTRACWHGHSRLGRFHPPQPTASAPTILKQQHGPNPQLPSPRSDGLRLCLYLACAMGPEYLPSLWHFCMPSSFQLGPSWVHSDRLLSQSQAMGEGSGFRGK